MVPMAMGSTAGHNGVMGRFLYFWVNIYANLSVRLAFMHTIYIKSTDIVNDCAF